MSTSTRRGGSGPTLPRGGGAGAARQSTLREHNLAVVLERVIGAHAVGTPLSRSGIAGEVGLARATVSDLVDRLIGARLVTELDPLTSPGAGRPAVPLAPTARSVVGLGLSVGTDHLAALVVDLTGLTVTQRVVEADLRGRDPAETLAQLAELAADARRAVLAQGMVVAGACVALPGLVSRESARLRYAPNLGWQDLGVDTALHAHPDLASLPVTAANDADLAARTEVEERRRRERAPVEEQSYLFVYGAVGIGSAVVLGGQVFGGLHGWSGEIGHVLVDPKGPPCHCGSDGCLEPYAGREALATCAGLPLDTSVQALAHAAAAPGPVADAVAAAGASLGQAAATVVNVVDVDEVVLGGIYAPLFAGLAPTVLAELERRALIARWSSIRLTKAVGGTNAAARGAALVVLDDVVADPSRWLGGPT
ncbi:ROK family protein [Oryzobacter sp. R7]|uniref:ROK family protein n=1 Tax=Oryzobacter faecalis TaxID=3388656 RepID=UPI00398CE66A